MPTVKFEDEILGPRAVTSSIWTCMISLGWLVGGILISTLSENLFHPMTAIQEVIGVITSPYSWPPLLMFCGLVYWWSLQHSSTFTTTPSVLDSWSSVFRNVLVDPKIFYSIYCNCLVSIGLTWCFLKLCPVQYSSTLSPCSEDPDVGYCINQKHIFLLASAVFTGAGIGIRYNFLSENGIIFPIIYKDRSSQIKQKLKPLVYISVRKALGLMKLFYLSVFLFTLTLKSQPIPALTYYLDVPLLLVCLCVVTLLLMINSTRLAAFNVVACQPIKLSLEEHLATFQGCHPLLRLLSLQHLAQLTAQSEDARKIIFSLSQPGGHPHSWNTLSKSCLANISDISDSITAITAPKPTPIIQAAPQPPEVINTSMRRLAPTLPSAVEDVVQAPAINSHLHNVIKDRINGLKSKPFLSSFFQKSHDHATRTVLCRSQAARWSIEILSQLVTASVSEDKFGVVQRDLPVILSSLLTLEQVLMRARALGVAGKEPDMVLRQDLRQTIRSSLYRIVIKFGEHILEVPLPKEFRLKMENYQRFLEA